MKYLYLALIVSAVYLFQGCSFTTPLMSIDLTDNRKVLIERNGTKIEISGDINGVEDYGEIHKLLKKI